MGIFELLNKMELACPLRCYVDISKAVSLPKTIQLTWSYEINNQQYRFAVTIPSCDMPFIDQRLREANHKMNCTIKEVVEKQS